jgi:GT2 family glycosyltransferase
MRLPSVFDMSAYRHADIVTEAHRSAIDPSARRPEASGRLATAVSVVVCTYRRPDSIAALLQSVARQDSQPCELLVVDASPTPEAIATRHALDSVRLPATDLHYWQVTGPLRGLTRQRNFALGHVTCDLILFVDDDVILEPECIRDMEAAHRSGRAVAGVGSFSSNQNATPSALWRIRRILGIVPNLQPGRYSRSGLSIPWGFGRPNGAAVEGDWLPGCAMMWRTDVVRAIGFDEAMSGYAQGEDLDFSLRARRMGRLIMLGQRRIEHRHAASGRPNPFELGYMELRNRFEIHRRGLPDRTWLDVSWFAYAWTLDTVLLLGHLAVPRRQRRAAKQIAGRMVAAWHLLTARLGSAPLRDVN